jgi:hypothetical protein
MQITPAHDEWGRAASQGLVEGERQQEKLENFAHSV